MESGVEVDINRLRPKEMVDAEREAVNRTKKESTLAEKAEFLNIAASPEGKKLIELVVKKMQDRINRLITDDPEASAYKKILNEMRYRENMAKKAINELYDLHMD